MSNLPSPNQSNRPPLWFLLLLGLGGPLATGITIAQARQSIWQSVGTGTLFLIIFLAFSIVAGVWQQLADNWVKRIADWVNSSHNYQKLYCQWFIEQHNQIDIGGLRTYDTPLARLEHIFVELNFARKPPYQISSSAFNVSEHPPVSQHSISYYIEHTQNHLVLLGRPGSGKTVTLRNLGVSLINRNEQRKLSNVTMYINLRSGIQRLWSSVIQRESRNYTAHSNAGWYKGRYKQPFLLSLRDYGNTIKEQDQFSLVDAIQTSLRKWNRVAPPGWIEGWLKKGQCLILFDGLDEIPDAEARQAIAIWVEYQMVTYGQKNRFILTSRPQGYRDNPINGKVTVLEVQKFSYAQIEEFVHQWYRAEENIDSPKHAPKTFLHTGLKADSFLQRLRGTHTLFDLASNPLLLTMSIMVDRHRGVLPGSRGELYKEIFEVFLGGRQRSKGLRVTPSSEQNQLVLQYLAFYMMEKEKEELMPAIAQSVIEEPLKSVNTQLTPQAFLEIIEDSNIWVKQGADVYGFAHLSFQEYLAAIHVKEKNLFPILVKHIGDSWWQEAIILYCNRADASPIIEECLTRKPLSISVLRLALECEEAASRSSSIDPSVRTQFNNLLIQGAESADHEIRHIVAEAWLAQQMKKMIPLSDIVYVTISLIASAEYQLFLDEQQEGERHQPDHWKHEHFPPGQGRAPILGVRPSDALAFCAWLAKRDPENWLYRLPQKNELEKIEELGGEEGSLMIGSGYWIDEGRGLAWTKKEAYLSNGMLRNQLDRMWVEDEKRAQDVNALKVLHTSDDRRLHLAKHLTIARNLTATYTFHRDLVGIIASIREHILHHEGELKTNYDNAHNETSGLQALLAEKKKEKAGYQRQLGKRHVLETSLASANIKTTNLRNQFEQANKNIESLRDQLAKKDAQVKKGQSQPFHALKKAQKNQLQSQITPANMQKDSLEVRLKSKQEEKVILASQRNETRALVGQLQEQIDSIDEDKLNEQIDEASRLENELNKQLDEARRQEDIQKKRLDYFRTQALPFYNICNHFFTFTPTYDGDGYYNALVRNNILDFDHILVVMNNSMQALNYVDRLIGTYIRELAESLTHYYHNVDISIDGQDIKPNIARALQFVEQMRQINPGDNAQLLGRILASYFNYLNQNRPFGKEETSHIRLYTRYFAGMLARHLLYWSWSELASSGEQSSNSQQMVDQSIIDTYFDVYISFVLLEERITGNLTAREGILIVKEQREENGEAGEGIV